MQCFTSYHLYINVVENKFVHFKTHPFLPARGRMSVVSLAKETLKEERESEEFPDTRHIFESKGKVLTYYTYTYARRSTEFLNS
jgi:hypothetical protein